MACKTIHFVSVPNLESFGPMERIYGPKKLDKFILCFFENGLQGILLPTNVAVATWNVWRFFLTLNSCNSCIYWYIDLKLAETFRNQVIYIVLKFCQ